MFIFGFVYLIILEGVVVFIYVCYVMLNGMFKN